MAPHDELFQRLQAPAQIHALIGQTENLHLDCKIWPLRDDDAQRLLAKALCGFANADGGVIVFGMEAKPEPTKYDPDLIQKPVPITDPVAVSARIETLVGDLVEPRLKGVRTAAILDPGSTTGFVVVGIPPTDGLPCRSRKDKNFYQRITSGTYPMEYFQIADMFGKRHRPKLNLFLEVGEYRLDQQLYIREFTVGMENSGRAVARFPSIRFNQVPGINLDPYGIDGNYGFGLPKQPTEPTVLVFAGGADRVIYPGTILKIAKLHQRAKATGYHVGSQPEYYFEEYIFAAELSADECLGAREEKVLPKLDIP